MARDFDGWAIARQRIANEAHERTGKLDLAGLGLEEIPKEVAALTHLRELDLHWSGGDKVVDFEGRTFEAKRNEVRTLVRLTDLMSLQLLNCKSTDVSDLAPLAAMTSLQSLDCSWTRVGDLVSLARLTSLRSLDCTQTRVTDLASLSGLTALQSLNCSLTQVSDLAPLAGLATLESIASSGSRIIDLAPLEGLTSLKSIDCTGTEVDDLAPLTNVALLESLGCGRTQIIDLAPLAGLTSLQSLSCFLTQVADLAPLVRLNLLRSLDCWGTQVVDLAPLASLASLLEFDCSDTPVSNLAPLAGLTSLQTLNCGSTQVSDFAPLAGLASLQTLSCSCATFKDAPQLAGLLELIKLLGNVAAFATLRAAPAEAPQLAFLYLFGVRIPGVPANLLSSLPDENCLPALRAYFLDSGPDDPRVEDVKLMVLGNGRVGKTQLCRNLMGEPFEPKSDSTHGVTIATVPLPRPRGAAPIPFHLWDFGGQDIYHGTHALFLRDHAIFVLVWAKGFEARDPAGKDGEIFGHRPLRYWVDYVRHLGGKERAAAVVQTRCDAPTDMAPCPVSEAELAGAFGLWSRVNFSAATRRGQRASHEALVEAAEFALEKEGAPKIPLAWSRVKAALESLYEVDQKRPVRERRHRTLTTDEFATICRNHGVKSEPKHLLQYLHRTGVVFHRPDLMQDRIVLDQAWALEAIYAVFERSDAYYRIKSDRGRFRPSDLAATAWRDRSEADRALFLEMMRECGVCFQPREGDLDTGEEPVYVAPELLPAREKVAVLIDSL
jgi:internalin A